MYRNFDVPWYYDGWDRIGLLSCYDYSKYYGNTRAFYFDNINFSQDNSHHTLTLGEHCKAVWDIIAKDVGEDNDELIYAGLLHDCGKPFCKTFTNSRGEVTEQAHYYNHEKVGSYNSLFYDVGNDLDLGINSLKIAILIRWHMQLYFIKEEKTLNKYRKLWGDELYRDLQLLHEADKNAH
jgi:hypothetical protein